MSCLLSKDILNKQAQNNWHLEIYEAIKSYQYENVQILQLAVLFIKTVVLGNEVLELELAQRIKKDLEVLAEKKDLSIISSFLLPLLTGEHMQPVCLHPFDTQIQKFFFPDSFSRKSRVENDFECALVTNSLDEHFSPNKNLQYYRSH